MPTICELQRVNTKGPANVPTAKVQKHSVVTVLLCGTKSTVRLVLSWSDTRNTQMEMSRWKRFRLFFGAAELLNRRQIGWLFCHPCAISNPNDVAFFILKTFWRIVYSIYKKAANGSYQASKRTKSIIKWDNMTVAQFVKSTKFIKWAKE